MSAKKNIVIYETGHAAQQVLGRALEAEGLGGLCLFESPENYSSGQNALWLYDPGKNPPSDLLENNCFEKPVRLGVLLDRIRVLSGRKGQDHSKALIKLGPYELDCLDNVLRHRETAKTTRLTDKEKDILRLLHGQNGGIVTRAALLEEIWGYTDDIETHTLETHIYRLRQKIEQDAANPQILLTEESGYRLSV